MLVDILRMAFPVFSFLGVVELRRHFFFLKSTFCPSETGFFKNKCVEGVAVDTPTPSFFQAAIQYTNPGNPFTRKSRWSCRHGRMGKVYLQNPQNVKRSNKNF